jgi:hypothetical protein
MGNYTDQKISVRNLAERAPGYRASFKASKKAFQDLRDTIAAELVKAQADTTELAAYTGNNKAILAEQAAAALVVAELNDLDAKVQAVIAAIANLPA